MGALFFLLLFLLPRELARAPGQPLPPRRWGGGWMLAQKWPWGCREDMGGKIKKALCPREPLWGNS